MARLRFDAVKGALDAALDTGTTTISSPGLARLGAVASPNVALICLYGVDPNGNITSSENVYVTAHTAGSTFATITRAGDGTTAGQWVVGSQWTHGFGVADVADIEANSTSGVTTFNTRSGAVTLTKSDVTGTGLTYTDVGADASGAAASAQSAAQTYSDRYAGSAAGTSGRPLAATDASVTNPRTPTAHASTHGVVGSDPVAIASSQVSGLGGAAALNVGTTTGTVAAGDDSRITGAAQTANNLSDLASTSTARTNLGLGSSAITSSSVLNVLDYGVVNDAYLGAGGTLSSSTWTDSAAPFTSASVGKSIWIEQTNGVWFRTTIATYISSTQVTITATPATVDFQGVYIFGTDNSTALTSLWSTATTLANSGQAKPVYFPAGGYLFNTGILSRTTLAQSAIQILGGGLQQTTFYPINVSATPGACVTTSMTDTAYWYSGPVNISTPKIAPVLDFAINGNLTGTGDIGIDHGPGIGGIYRVYVANFDQVPDTTYPTSGNAGGRGWRIRNLIVSGTTRYTEQTKFLAGAGVDKCFVGVEIDAATGTNSFEGTNFENFQVRITEPGARAFMVRGSGTVSALLYHSTINANGVVGPGCSSEGGTFFRSKMTTALTTGLKLAATTASPPTYTANQQITVNLASNTLVSISAGTTILIGGVYFTSPSYQAVGSSSINLIAPNASGTVGASTNVLIPYGFSGCPAIIGITSGSVSGTVTSLPTSAGTNWRVQDGQIVNLVNPTTISATTTSSSNIVTLASGNTATVWQGCSVLIPGAGPSGGPLLTNVTKVLSSTTFQTQTSASVAVSGASGTVNVQQAFMVYGNNASAATAINTYSVTANATFASGSFVELPPVGIVVGTPRPGVSNTTTDASRLVGSVVNWQMENSGAQATSILAFVSPSASMQYSGWVGSSLINYPIVQAYGTFQTTAGTLAAGATAGLTNASSGIGIKGNATTPYDVFIPGGTASGAPSSGTHNLFEIVPDATGVLWICTVAGTPGTWVSVAPSQVQTNFYVTAGAYSGTTPTWAKTAEIIVVGGGGGGGGSVVSTAAGGGGGGGGAGVVLSRVVPVLANTAYSGVVGAGGGGGAAGANGSGGTASTFVHNSQTYSALGGAYGSVGVSGGIGAGGLYGTAGPSGYVSLTMGSGGLGGSSTTASSTVGPIPFGASGGAGGYPSSGAGATGGKGGAGGASTGGAVTGGANTGFADGTVGSDGESSVYSSGASALTKPGGGGGGGGGAAGTSGAAKAGGAGGTGSVTIIFRAA